MAAVIGESGPFILESPVVVNQVDKASRGLPRWRNIFIFGGAAYSRIDP